jgi:plastocyanin
MFVTNKFLIVLAVGVALVASGCGSSKKKSSASSNTTTSTTSAGGASAVALSANPSGALSFDKTSASAKPGKVTFVMSNPGSSGIQHGIAVEGNGVDKDGPIVQPGNKSTLTVTLKPGKYTFYCPFDSHKAQGMKGTLTVSSTATSSGGSSGGSSSSGSSSGSSGSRY